MQDSKSVKKKKDSNTVSGFTGTSSDKRVYHHQTSDCFTSADG